MPIRRLTQIPEDSTKSKLVTLLPISAGCMASAAVMYPMVFGSREKSVYLTILAQKSGPGCQISQPKLPANLHPVLGLHVTLGGG